MSPRLTASAHACEEKPNRLLHSRIATPDSYTRLISPQSKRRANSRRDGNAELSSVVTHSRLRDTELPRDLGNPETLVEQVGNRPTALSGRALRGPWPRSDLAPADRRCPSGVGETEPALAFLGTVAGVVESPDGFPIVDLRPSLPSRKANPSSDAGNRLTRDFESPANFDLWNPLLKQPTNFPIPAIHRTDVRNQTGRNRRNEAG
jgi:hypothetical protein